MESRTVEPDSLNLSEDDGVSDALCEAVEEEIGFLEDRDVKLVRMRADEEGDVFQVTIHAGDEMYRMSEVAPGHVSRTVFRDPEKDGAMPYQEGEEEVEEAAEEKKESEEETEEEAGGEEDADGEEDVSEEDEEEKEGETKEKDEEAPEGSDEGKEDEAGNESEVENEESDEGNVEEKTEE